MKDADFVLIIDPFGIVSLYESGDEDDPVWTSTSDEEFTDEFGDELLGDDDVDDILDYLVESQLIDESSKVDTEIQSAEDFNGNSSTH